ncbi:hypothetical protein [Kitasatospora sp. NPDC001683]
MATSSRLIGPIADYASRAASPPLSIQADLSTGIANTEADAIT